LTLGLALFELVASPLIRAAVPRDQSWEEATAFVRARFRPSDGIVAAPSWADPIVRHHLGDLLSLSTAAPSDLARFERIWEIGIRGATTRDDPPALEEDFDGVRVRMWRIAADQVIYDFVEEVEDARVELELEGGARVCPWVSAPLARGGLGHGPMTPAERFACDARRPWLWVGATVLSDLDLQPRRCVWQHPAGVAPVRVTFADVPLGERLVVHGGVDYHAERERIHRPVTLRVFIDDRLAGELVHEDGDGWSSAEIATSELAQTRATVRFETTAEDPTARLFCWAASTRAKGIGQ
jgi:hypothetical protein